MPGLALVHHLEEPVAAGRYSFELVVVFPGGVQLPKLATSLNISCEKQTCRASCSMELKRPSRRSGVFCAMVSEMSSRVSQGTGVFRKQPLLIWSNSVASPVFGPLHRHNPHCAQNKDRRLKKDQAHNSLVKGTKQLHTKWSIQRTFQIIPLCQE